MKVYGELSAEERQQMALKALRALAKKYPKKEDVWFGPQDVANTIKEQQKMYPVWPNYVRDTLESTFYAGKICRILIYRTKRGEKNRVDSLLGVYRPLPEDLV